MKRFVLLLLLHPCIDTIAFIIDLQKLRKTKCIKDESLWYLKSSVKDDIKILTGTFSPSPFEDSWEREVVLLRKAFPSEQLAWPTWELVEEISSDFEAEARLITHVPDDPTSFDLDLGPFEDLSCLESSTKSVKSTLVVNDVDRFHPPLADWIDQHFNFIPRWRRDDAQVSLAEKGGGIGPHVDNYGVFLIQTSGTREWQVGSQKISVQDELENLIPEIPVRILKNWNDISYFSLSLEPGDTLYLPPRVPHCGIATTDNCITLSIGCRSPSASELVTRMAEEIASCSTHTATQRFQDFDLLPNPSMEITDKEKSKMKGLILDAVAGFLSDNASYDKLIGQVVTESKRFRQEYPVPLDELDPENLEELGVWGNAKEAINSVYNGHGALYRAEGISSTFSKVISGRRTKHRIYMDGEMFELEVDKVEDEAVHALFLAIVSAPEISSKVISPVFENKEIMNLLESMIQRGLLYGSESD